MVNGVRGQLEAELRRLVQDAVADVRQKAHLQLAEIREAAQRHTDDLKRLSDAQLAELRTTLDATRNRAEADVEDARRVAQTQVDDVQRVMEERLGDLQAQVSEGQRRLAAADARTAEAERQVLETRRQVDNARVARSRDGDRIGRLARAVRSLGDADTLGDAFERLADAAAGEAQRVAVMVARGERLHGWTLRGFGDELPPARSLAIDPAEAASPPFAAGSDARTALSLPLVVGGTAVAVLYADAPAMTAGEREQWTDELDLLVRHASRVLEALMLQQAIGLLRPNSMARPSHDLEAGSRSDRS